LNKLRIAVALLFLPMALHAQDKTRIETPVPANKRAAYCESHPTDSFNCTAIPATSEDGTHITIGLAKICPGQPKDVQDKKSNVASWLAMDGIDNEGFEKMGLCKLSNDETTALLQHQWSRVTSRAYYDTDKRQPKKIYVALEPGSKETPDIVMSDFRNALRSIPDVELITAC